MKVDLGVRAASIGHDERSAAYESVTVHELVVPAGSGPATARRAFVELRRLHGGLAPRVLLGAMYTPEPRASVAIQVGVAAPGHGRRSCRVQLSGRRMYPGLPADLAECALRGLALSLNLGGGIVTVDRARCDPVDTSPAIVEQAAQFLGLTPSCESLPPTVGIARDWLERLP